MSAGLSAIVNAFPPIVRQFAGGLIKNIEPESEVGQIGVLVETLAEAKGVSPDEFIASGELLKTVKSLVGIADSESVTRSLEMFKCPNCNHITYEVKQ